MTATDSREDARRVQHALLAHLRQEFIAPAAAIVGYTEILIEDAKRLSLDGYLADLERIHSAGQSLHALLQSVLAQEHADDTVIFDQSKLRHDLRTPINAIKGYGEMLVEDRAHPMGFRLSRRLTRSPGSELEGIDRRDLQYACELVERAA